MERRRFRWCGYIAERRAKIPPHHTTLTQYNKTAIPVLHIRAQAPLDLQLLTFSTMLVHCVNTYSAPKNIVLYNVASPES